MEHLANYQKAVEKLDAKGIVQWALQTFGTNRIVLASSFSIEDQVLTDMLVKNTRQSRIFTLDTGRHFQETYDVWQSSSDFWKISYEVGFPDSGELTRFVDNQGPNSFYHSVELRKSCCTIRKTHPLKKILSTVDAWIVGLRSEQSVTRSGLAPVEWDEANNIYRISPLFNWNEKETFAYVKDHSLPVSQLYTKGFRSIGCAPCTRAIRPEDDVRAGRWWWEEPEHKECGLHNRPKQ